MEAEFAQIIYFLTSLRVRRTLLQLECWVGVNGTKNTLPICLRDFVAPFKVIHFFEYR